jgi:phosphocarrier protein HPr
MVSKSVLIINTLGMHARAAAKFVHTASAYQSRISVTRGTRTMDGKSILGVLLLAAARGGEIVIAADGADEAEALDDLCGLVASGFGEGPCNA